MKLVVSTLLILAAILPYPLTAGAAYQSPTIVDNQLLSEGFVRLTFTFSGNAGEPTVTRSFVVNSATTATKVRNWVADTIDELDLLYAASTLPSIQKGQSVPRLNRTPPTLTAKQIWQAKHRRYLEYKDSDIAAIVSERAALKADLEATYQSGYLAE